ncbi:hypothetical protein [Spirosoma areae]
MESNQELRQYYEQSFAPNQLSVGFRPVFEQLSDAQKKLLRNSLGFTCWRQKLTGN